MYKKLPRIRLKLITTMLFLSDLSLMFWFFLISKVFPNYYDRLQRIQKILVIKKIKINDYKLDYNRMKIVSLYIVN